MHLFWTFLGMVPVRRRPPLTTSGSNVSCHVRSAPNPEIEGLRSELLTALSDAGGNFRLSLEQGEAYARAGTKVANNVIYPLEQFIAGKLETKHLPDIARSLDKPITQLLENAKEMHGRFGGIQTELEKVQMKTQIHGQSVDRAIAEAQDAIDESRSARALSNVFAGVLGVVGFAFPPAALLAGGLALNADAHHENVVAGLTAIQPWHVFADNLRTMRDVVGRAQGVTGEQIRFWSRMRDQVEQLKDSSANWLEDLSSEWMATKLLAEWKGVAQQYSQCAHTTSDAHRFLDAHLTAKVPVADPQELLGPIHGNLEGSISDSNPGEIPMTWMYAALGILFLCLNFKGSLSDSNPGGSSTHRLHGGSCDAANEADNQHPGTFVIYFPNDDWSSSLRPFAESFTTNDLTCLQASHGLGALLSVHDPTEAATWIEDHWDSELLTSIRHGGWGGPLSCMLSPEEPALAIFGSYENPTVVNMAQSLTKASGFPVVIRSACDNPALTLMYAYLFASLFMLTYSLAVPTLTSGENNDDRQPTGDGRPLGSGTGERGSGADRYDQAPNRDDAPQGSGGGGGSGGGDDAVNETSPNHGPSDTHSSDDGDGGGGGGSPSTVDGQWESPLHRTCVKLALKPDADRAYAVAISYTFKFTINRDTDIPIDLTDLTRPLSQPEVIAALDFQIETRPRETQVDRSYASIGFVVHREESIAERKLSFYPRVTRMFDANIVPARSGSEIGSNLNRTELNARFRFSVRRLPEPNTTFRFGVQALSVVFEPEPNPEPHSLILSGFQSIFRAQRASLTIKLAALTVVHSRNFSGPWLRPSSASLRFNIQIPNLSTVQNPELDAQHPDYPLEVRVGMGINIRPPGSKTPLPKISFVNRNQVLIWVSDPTSKARIRGIMVLMSSHLDDIRTDEELSIYEKAVVESASLTAPQGTYPNYYRTKAQGDKAGTISLSIAQVQTQSVARFNRLLPLFSTKLGQRSPVCSLADIETHEYLARGWDANNNEWRQVLWPALDKNFRAADFEGKSRVWKIHTPKDGAQTPTNVPAPNGSANAMLTAQTFSPSFRPLLPCNTFQHVKREELQKKRRMVPDEQHIEHHDVLHAQAALDIMVDGGFRIPQSQLNFSQWMKARRE
ncbi:hypothetical protein C8F04DRAFT_1179640 [Mycena alexandri]|uniref:Uncharacterized protein n=1 Tax=Mycena alexandri TaxID=1745969 RepID=A0AAD6T2N4_9AGAR|nr:hypothetical protein C8F04DRAFT_1179640 [Mycena alexandri]